ncbi:hypothetical protein Y032_0448g1634 [Ancylostoma ceylanicum]|uniref:RNA-directed DNA polymerase n=2 Tax=Ancylostoma ceylanicum TaxID=53326 RepID=A0A016WZW9_9BILA|nr:hypothetical protein Y032_0448g1634 [Ancylostoma ceylanicum]
MDMVLKGLRDKEVFVYIDDILIATETKERHFEVLKLVLEALRAANLKFKPQKCIFLCDRVAFLGHEVTRSGVRVDPSKIERIQQYPRPTCVAEMRAFLGLCGYYRKLVFGFSKIAQPLFELTKAKAPWKWEETQENAFAKLKECLKSAPVLSQPDVEAARSGERPYAIYTDAS